MIQKSIKWLFWLGIPLVIVVAWVGGQLLVKKERCTEHDCELNLPTSLDAKDLPQYLLELGIIEQRGLFALAWKKLNPEGRIYPGKYQLSQKSSVLDLIRKFRSGRRVGVKVTLAGRLGLDDVSGYLGQRLEVDSADFHQWLIDSSGIGRERILCYFLCDTYEFRWAGTEKDVWNRFMREYTMYWTDQRQQAAQKIGLSLEEVIILASIVEGEVRFNEEMPRIAGVYLNRLRKNWLLGADPTIQYLVKESGRQRILNSDKEIDSPYNTYKYIGLPPGPIFTPSKRAIEAVLSAEIHDYMYFCARDDLSGYHNFSKSLFEHGYNARRYRKALDRAGIMR